MSQVARRYSGPEVSRTATSSPIPLTTPGACSAIMADMRPISPNSPICPTRTLFLLSLRQQLYRMTRKRPILFSEKLHIRSEFRSDSQDFLVVLATLLDKLSPDSNSLDIKMSTQ